MRAHKEGAMLYGILFWAINMKLYNNQFLPTAVVLDCVFHKGSRSVFSLACNLRGFEISVYVVYLGIN
jgi:hypothetical protein